MRHVIALATIGWLAAASAAVAQSPATSTQAPKASIEKASSWQPDEGNWMPLPDIFPKGGEMKVMRGNPATGPAEFYFKFPAGYGVPWHFHTPIERLFVDKGTMSFEMRDGRKISLEEGGYVYFPSRAPHKASCTGKSTCFFFLASDAPFDIHLVDEKWNVTESWRAGEAAAESD